MLANSIPNLYKCHTTLNDVVDGKVVNTIKISDYEDKVIYNGIAKFIINDGFYVTFKDDSDKVHNYKLKHLFTVS